MKLAKKYAESIKSYDRSKSYDLTEAVKIVIDTAKAKFDETVELHVRLGVDPRQADQQVRGVLVLPNGTGKQKKVLVIAKGDKADAATAAGADYVGAEETIQRIQKENWFDFDVMITTPDMMGIVGRIGRILGPKGLMPNPKSGTVTMDVAKAVKEVKGNGSRTLIVFTDVDCPYSRKLAKTLEQVSDVTVYTFLFPLVSIHPEAKAKSDAVWCAADSVKELAKALNGETVKSVANNPICTSPVESTLKLAAELGIGGTPTLINAAGDRTAGALPLEKLEEFINQGNKKSKS